MEAIHGRVDGDQGMIGYVYAHCQAEDFTLSSAPNTERNHVKRD